MITNTPSWIFFGTGPLAESVLMSLVRAGYIPKYVVTKPDAPSGRHLVMTKPYIKTWCELKGITVLQPNDLKTLEESSPLYANDYDVFIVASYGKIIPEKILETPNMGVLNVHPSLLPKYRGASPLESALLDGNITSGVSIMKLDKEMDHGPILVQNSFMINPLANAGTLEVTAGQLGGELLVSVLPHYLEGTLTPKEQDHSQATFCKKITKDLGLVNLDDSVDIVRRKFRALTPWPGLYFFIEHAGKTIRVKVNEVDLVKNTDESHKAADYILSVTPEGKKEMDWESFKRGYIEKIS
jgi:methionyl-tRNA formyltransferase